MLETDQQTLPLRGKHVLVTRTHEQAGTLSESLRAAGAIPVELPVIRIVPPVDWQPLDQALRALAMDGTPAFDWLIFTSANGVRMALQRLTTLGLSVDILRRARIATIGPATAAALTAAGLSADLVPTTYIAEAVAEELLRVTGSLAGQKILLARAAEARQVLIEKLQQAGARVTLVAAYRTLPADQDDERGREVISLLRAQKLDIITFTSSSTVNHFLHWLGQAAPDIAITLAYPHPRPPRPLIACIGPITARTARDYGLEVNIEAEEFTTIGLVQSLITYEKRQK